MAVTAEELVNLSDAQLRERGVALADEIKRLAADGRIAETKVLEQEGQVIRAEAVRRLEAQGQHQQ